MTGMFFWSEGDREVTCQRSMKVYCTWKMSS
jgi:hypothetical protein